jgi:hypothetical protein
MEKLSEVKPPLQKSLRINMVCPKIQQTKMLVTLQRFGDFLLFGLVWQYSTNKIRYNKGYNLLTAVIKL